MIDKGNYQKVKHFFTRKRRDPLIWSLKCKHYFKRESLPKTLPKLFQKLLYTLHYKGE